MALRTPNKTVVIEVQYLDENLPSQARMKQDRHLFFTKLATYFQALASGTTIGIVSYLVDGGSATAASGTFTYDTTSGSTQITVNGVALAAQASGTDAARATADAAAINGSANALISGVVTAAAVNGVLTVTAVKKGKSGNWVTLAASGTGVTASGTRLTGGADAAANSVTV